MHTMPMVDKEQMSGMMSIFFNIAPAHTRKSVNASIHTHRYVNKVKKR